MWRSLLYCDYTISSPYTSHWKAKSFRDVKALVLVLQNHFSSLDDFETTNVVSKFWANPNEMEEDANNTGEEIVCTKRKSGRPPRGLVNKLHFKISYNFK